MSERSKQGGDHVGPEPWRVASVRDYDGPPPIPVDEVECRLPDGWVVTHEVFLGRFGGVMRWIPITTARHPEHGVYQWFPISPDAPRRSEGD